jgi:hypothetical protein
MRVGENHGLTWFDGVDNAIRITADARLRITSPVAASNPGPAAKRRCLGRLARRGQSESDRCQAPGIRAVAKRHHIEKPDIGPDNAAVLAVFAN